MNDTITLPRLISRLAEAAGCSPAVARKYIHDLFADVEDAIEAGETYTVEGLGEFAPGIDAANPVLFRPDPALAAALNEPFEAFTAIELPADYTPEPPAEEPQPEPEEATESAAEEPEPEPEEAPEPAAEEPEPELEEATEPLWSSVIPEGEEAAEPEGEEVAVQEPEEEPEPEAEPEPEPATAPAGNHAPWMVFLCGALVGLIIGLIAGYFAGDAVSRYHIPEEDDDDYDSDTTELAIFAPVAQPAETDTATAAETLSRDTADTTSPAPTQPASPTPAPTEKAPVYDTITSTRFLTTMARDHYGVKAYWVFIYEANPELGNPNHIRPGTRIRIPDISTFREATPEATKQKAQQHLNALAEKYKL